MSTKRNSKKAGTAATKKSPVRRAPKKSPPVKAAPKAASPRRAPKQADRDPRLPAVGSTMTRQFKGKEIKVKVLADGFEFEGEKFTSISAVARHIVGYMISGPVFFKLAEPKQPEAK